MKDGIIPAIVLAVVAAALLFPPVAAEDEASRDRRKLVGAWEGWVVHGRGERPNSGPVRLTEVVITLEKITARQADDRSLGEGSYRLNTARNPRTLDSTGTGGEVQSKTFQGIYALEGDTLKWCVSNPGRPRPTAFATRPGAGQFFMVLKRRNTAGQAPR